MRINFKTYLNDGTNINNQDDESLEVEYKLGKKRLKVELKKEDEFLGVEHKIEF